MLYDLLFLAGVGIFFYELYDMYKLVKGLKPYCENFDQLILEKVRMVLDERNNNVNVD